MAAALATAAAVRIDVADEDVHAYLNNNFEYDELENAARTLKVHIDDFIRMCETRQS
jgi:hypothetical protein